MRFAVGDQAGLHSHAWKVFTRRNEVYVVTISENNSEKISLHSSGICRRAFTNEHKLPASMDDRVLQRWRRGKTVPAGNGKAEEAFLIIFPNVSLSSGIPASPKISKWLSPPPPGEARAVSIRFTRERLGTLKLISLQDKSEVIWFQSLPNGENVYAAYINMAWIDVDVVKIASHGAKRDLVIPGYSLVNPSRNVSFIYFPSPNAAVQTTGFWVPAGTGVKRFPHADTVSTSKVIQSSAAVDGGVSI